MPSIAIEPFVVPADPPGAPVGFETLQVTLTGPVPAEIALADGWSVLLQVPTGTARTWLAADGDALVATSALEWQPRDPAATPPRVAPARLVVRRGGPPLGAVPLTVGVLTRVRDPGSGSGLLELIPLAWEIRVAALVGGTGRRPQLQLAWRSRFPVHFDPTIGG